MLKQINLGREYQYFVDRFPNSVYWDEANQLRDDWWNQKYEKLRVDGEMSTLLQFERENYDFPFKQLLQNDKQLASLAVSLNL